MLESYFSSRHEHVFKVRHSCTTTLNKFKVSKSRLGTSVETQLLLMFNGEKQTRSLPEMALSPC